MISVWSERADEGLAGAHRPLSLFTVVLMVFLGKEGSLEMLTGGMNGKRVEISLLIPPRLILGSIVLMGKWSTEQEGDWARVHAQRPGPVLRLQRGPKPAVHWDRRFHRPTCAQRCGPNAAHVAVPELGAPHRALRHSLFFWTLSHSVAWDFS